MALVSWIPQGLSPFRQQQLIQSLASTRPQMLSGAMTGPGWWSWVSSDRSSSQVEVLGLLGWQSEGEKPWKQRCKAENSPS